MIPIWACAASPVTANQHFCSPTPTTWHRVNTCPLVGTPPSLIFLQQAPWNTPLSQKWSDGSSHPPPPSTPTIVVIPPRPASLVPEPLVVPARTLQPRRRAPPASSTPATAPLPRLPIHRSRSRSSSALAARLRTTHAPTQPALHRHAMRHHPSCLSGWSPITPVCLMVGIACHSSRPPQRRHPATPSSLFRGCQHSLFSGCPLSGGVPYHLSPGSFTVSRTSNAHVVRVRRA